MAKKESKKVKGKAGKGKESDKADALKNMPDTDKPKEKVCTVCGNIAENETQYCEHQKGTKPTPSPKPPEANDGKVTVEAESVNNATGERTPLPGLAKILTDAIAIRNPELPGMPEKTEATKIAEDILDQKDVIKGEREKLKLLTDKFVGEMHLIQQSHLLVKGWEFEVELQDKVTITKKK